MRWSASALRYSCAFPRILDQQREPTPKQQEAMDLGNKFDAAIELWQRSGQVPNCWPGTELQRWIDLLAAQWNPLEAYQIRLQTAWGLGMDGSHVMVSEPRPHEYEPLSGGSPLLTAGRSDMIEWFEPADLLYVVDWKSGKWAVDPAEINLQVNSAGIALAKRFNLPAYLPGIYYARTGQWDWGSPVELGSTREADMFAAIRAAALLPPTPVPGPHCEACWEKKKRTCKEAA